jgi:uncharacterized damage-inducible protein DinB
LNTDPYINHLKDLCRYNVWANEKIAGFIAEAGEERCLMVQKSSYGTIRETLIHIWGAQYMWLERLQGRSPDNWPGKNFAGNCIQITDAITANSRQWEAMAESLLPEMAAARISYRNLSGAEFHNTAGQIMAHVMNHGTFHRGQIVTMLRGAGFNDLKQTDLIAFYRLFSN